MRKIDVVVISDVHLGTYGCHAKELIQYLDSIHPKKLILNGDIIDGWQFKKRYFPKEHYKVLQLILKKLKKGTKVYYLTGNHDDFLRKISGTSMGAFGLFDDVIFDEVIVTSYLRTSILMMSYFDDVIFDGHM